MMKSTIFDQPDQYGYAQARIEFLHEILPALKEILDLRTALDLGCGVGYFSHALSNLGLQTVGVDGRPENTAEASERHPHIRFLPANVEEPSVLHLGTFDLVLCFGLLYHLENPVLALRNTFAVTGKLLLLESQRSPSARPVIEVCDEGLADDQALHHIALYPSEASMVKILYRSGFRFVYRFTRYPDHLQFRSTFTQRRPRTLIAASRVPVTAPFLVLTREVANPPDLWATPSARAMQLVGRAWRFVRKPWPEKIATLRRRFPED
jgi:tRNA (mo5U34)-methyltransferase